VLPGLKVTAELLRNDDALEVVPLSAKAAGDVPQALAEFGPQAVALCNPPAEGFVMARPKRPAILKDLEPDHSEAWQKLGVAFLHAYLFDRLVAPRLCAGRAPEIRYVKAAQAAVDQAHETAGTAFLMQATTMEEMRGVCQADDLMPQKSTYFYPKLASGLVINPLTT